MMIYAAQLFDKLGFTINLSKSVLPPTRTKIIQHLGFIFNSVDITVQLTQEKMHCIAGLAKALSTSAKPTIQQLAQFVGKLVATEPGFTHAPLFYKEIEIYKNSMLAMHKGNYNATISLPDHILHLVTWWQSHVYDAICHVHVPCSEHYIASDASNLGWGGINDESYTKRGQWSSQEVESHINIRKLQAAVFMLKAFCASKHDTHIRLKLDNTTIVACINRLAGLGFRMQHQSIRRILAWM